MPTRRALVAGTGPAGVACAYRLLRSDWDVVLVNSPASPHTWGLPEVLTSADVDAARRLGLLPALTERRQPRCHLVHVDTAGVPLAVTPKPSPRRLAVCPDDVAEVLSDAIGDSVPRTGVELSGIAADDSGVTVTFANGEEDWFDLVVGADGVNSGVRDAVVGDQDRTVPRWSVMSGRVGLGSACAVTMNDVGRSVRLHPLRDEVSAVSFAWRNGRWPDPFADLGWIVPDLLSHVDGSVAAHTSSRTNRWAHGSVVLIGSAAWHVGPHADTEISLALVGAELLGDALDISTHTNDALRWWERTLRPSVRRAQTRGLAEQEAMWDLPITKSVNSKRSHNTSRRTTPASPRS